MRGAISTRRCAAWVCGRDRPRSRAVRAAPTACKASRSRAARRRLPNTRNNPKPIRKAPPAAANNRPFDRRATGRRATTQGSIALSCSNARPATWCPSIPSATCHRFTDVLIIGGGLAGLRAALAVPAEQSVLVVTKSTLRQSNSNFAQGGIAGVIDPEDRFEDHIADTLAAGGRLCDEAVVEMVVREAPERISELAAWGTKFDLASGSLALGREGGHSHHRIVHALGDATGKEVMRAVIDRALRCAQRRSLGRRLHARPADPRKPLPRRAGLERRARQDARLGQSRRSCAPAARARSIARRPTPTWPPATGWPWPIARAPSCATWSSCSSTPPCSTSPAAAAA